MTFITDSAFQLAFLLMGPIVVGFHRFFLNPVVFGITLPLGVFSWLYILGSGQDYAALAWFVRWGICLWAFASVNATCAFAVKRWQT